jgi:hypothetical protein
MTICFIREDSGSGQLTILPPFTHFPAGQLWQSCLAFLATAFVTGPLANNVALANKIASTPKLILFIFMDFKCLKKLP